MSYVRLNPPPHVQDYSCIVDGNSLNAVDPLALSLSPAIGKKINPDYENGTKRTPMQTLRLQLITVAAIAIIAAIGAAIAIAVTGYTPLIALVLPLAIVGIGSLLYYSFLGTDFDSPEERKQAVQNIARRSFRDIAANYSDDHLVGYNLLQGFISPIADPLVRARFYARFQQLRSINSGVDDWRNSQKHAVNSLWERETYPIRAWYSREQLIIDQQRTMMDQQEMILRSRTYHREACTGRPATGLRVATAAVSVGNYMTDLQLRQRTREIDQDYGAAMDPWNVWRSHSLARVESVYSSACNQVEHQFSWMKSAAVIS